MQGTKLLLPEQKESLANFLASCDLVKFAKYEPGENELRGLHASALRLIEETEPRRESPEAKTQQVSQFMNRHDVCASMAVFVAPAAAGPGVVEGQTRRAAGVSIFVGPTGARDAEHHALAPGRILASLRWVVLALLIIALAQPRLTKSTTEVKASGIDIVVALDLSGSMNTGDYIINGQQISRIDMAKPVLKEFIEGRPNDRIGLVVFAAEAFIAAPMTLDHDYLLETVDRLGIGSINSDATAIGDGITTALNRLRDLKSKSRIIVLMTDGGNNSGKIGPLMATEAAKALGVKIYTIGLGNREIVEQMGLPPGYQMVPVDVDEDTLQQIADMTGGKYFRADNAEKFQRIYAEIDKLEKTEASGQQIHGVSGTVPMDRGERAGDPADRAGPGPDCVQEAAMRFEHPYILWLLLVVPPVLALFFWWALRARQKLLTQFIEARLLTPLTVGISPARRKIRFALLILAVELLIVALARPQHGFDLQEVEQRGLDVVVAVDTSKSMLATDIAPNRLQRAKLAAQELMQSRPPRTAWDWWRSPAMHFWSAR